jgi:tetratricopeptide (TPR) repeat protein
MAKVKEKEEVIINVESAYDKTEQFFEDNQKIILGVVAAIIIIIGGYVGYKKFIIAPKETEAASQMFRAEQYFQQDSFRIALDGKGQYPGFLQIIDDYSMTDAANLSYYYAGVSYLHLGEYENAIEYLGKFDSDDEVLSVIAEGATGDAYMELGETDKAISAYIAAADDKNNKFTSPVYLMKAAQALEGKGETEKAVKLYERLEKEFPTSNEGRAAEKYKARAKASL